MDRLPLELSCLLVPTGSKMEMACFLWQELVLKNLSNSDKYPVKLWKISPQQEIQT